MTAAAGSLAAPGGRRHFGCQHCGRVFTLPAEPDEAGPWCLHQDSKIMWRPPAHPDSDWTQTVPVDVFVAPARTVPPCPVRSGR